MRRWIWVMGLAAAAAAGGCALPRSDLDDTYAAYGGRWQRDDRRFGRVGSVLDPAGARVPEGEPTPAVPPPAGSGD